jgi:hypothetical protein
VEGDLAYRGHDLRDLWRKGSGLTLRRLFVLIRSLPYESVTWSLVREDEEKALKPSVDKIRERQAHYARQREAANG